MQGFNILQYRVSQRRFDNTINNTARPPRPRPPSSWVVLWGVREVQFTRNGDEGGAVADMIADKRQTAEADDGAFSMPADSANCQTAKTTSNYVNTFYNFAHVHVGHDLAALDSNFQSLIYTGLSGVPFFFF